MANVGPLVWYVRDDAPTSTIGWSAVTAWSTGASKAAGVLVRQLATPTVNNERVFAAIVAGTTHATTEPTWGVTKGAKTTDNTVTWQEVTGQPGINGDIGNTPTWLQNKNTSVSLGLIVQRASAGSLQIVSTAGTTGNGAEPSFSNTAGVTTSDNTVTWTSLGAPGNFTAWAAPHARLANAFTSNWGAAGNTFYLGDDHAETQSSTNNISNPGAVASPGPVFVYSVDHTASFPLGSGNLLSGASISTTASAGLSINGTGYFYGITMNAGNSTGNAVLSFGQGNSWQRWDSCALRRIGTGNNNINMSSGGARYDLVNTTFQFGNVADQWSLGNNRVTWRNTSSAITGATLPTTFIVPQTQDGGVIVLEGIDVSALGSGKTIVGASNGAGAYDVHLIDCKLNASATIASTAGNPVGTRVYVTRSAATGIGYAQHQYAYEGTLDHETTIIRTGGASDGTTGISWKIVTTANSRWSLPFEAPPISIWNSTLGNVTVTVYGIWGSGSVPNNDDIWIDVEYLGSSSTPLASLGSGTKANNLATGAALTSDSSTWGGSTTPFKMAVLLSAPQPQLVGYLRIYVRAAKLSTTFYIDPLPVLS